jgi:hypothetical protein
MGDVRSPRNPDRLHYRDADTDIDNDCRCCGDTCIDYACAIANKYIYGNARTTGTNPYAHADAPSSNSDGNVYACSPYGYASSYVHAHGYADVKSDGNAHADRNAYRYPDAYCDA